MGNAGHYYNRVWVITGGCLIWGCMTLGFSMAPTIQAATLFWAVNGFGMSLAIPNVQVLRRSQNLPQETCMPATVMPSVIAGALRGYCCPCCPWYSYIHAHEDCWRFTLSLLFKCACCTACKATRQKLQDLQRNNIDGVYAQSVTADFYAEEDRGKAFGTLHLTSAAGAALGGLYATNLGGALWSACPASPRKPSQIQHASLHSIPAMHALRR